MDNTNIEAKDYTSSCGTRFQVICSQSTELPRVFGIKAIMDTDACDLAEIKNLFFTRAEAEECCRWLAENDVFPVSLYDVLANIYIL